MLGVIRRTFRQHGFDEVETPVVEDSDRLHAGLGGDNEKLAFAVMKRGLDAADLRAAAESGDPLDLADLGLRFDLTVPLARFYASHRGELPSVFRAIQIGAVWRAERPQKGRYRQFVQCDIDVLGEAGPMAEVELITATAATLDALGLDGCTVRVNDRRLLTSALDILGFPSETHEQVLIIVDKRDKIGDEGVIGELEERLLGEYEARVEAPAVKAAIDALAAFFRRPTTMEFLPFGEAAIRKFLPEGVDPVAVAELASIGLAVEAARVAAAGDGPDAASTPLVQFDPWLVRGMGYYTGTIFEIAHPSVDYSLGGGGRYDGMIGRFLGADVPAVGFSLGFERLVDLVDLVDDTAVDAVALLHDAPADPALLVALQARFIAGGARVRLERRPKNVAPLLQHLADAGFARYAVVPADASVDTELDFRPLNRAS